MKQSLGQKQNESDPHRGEHASERRAGDRWRYQRSATGVALVLFLTFCQTPRRALSARRGTEFLDRNGHTERADKNNAVNAVVNSLLNAGVNAGVNRGEWRAFTTPFTL